jgi:proton glutamate symport protein
MKNIYLAAFITSLLAIFTTLAVHYGYADIPAYIPMFTRWVFMAVLLYWGIKMKNMTTWILLSMVIGAEIGYDFPAFGQGLNIFSKIFIQMIKTVIAPLLFGTLVVGIAAHSNMKQVGRMGLKTLIYFEVITTVALFVGLAAINISKAGVNIPKKETVSSIEIKPDNLTMKIDSSSKGMMLNLKYNDKQIDVATPAKKNTWVDIVLHIFPENISKMIFENQVLQIVVFSILFAIGMTMVSAHHREIMLNFTESLSEVMFKFTNIIMYMAPLAIGGAIANTVGSMGIGILKDLGILLLTLYCALIVFALIAFVPIMLYYKIPFKRFFEYVKEPAALAFATASSEAALPLALRNMELFGVPKKIVAFVLPTGYTFNLDGSTLYLSLASVFVAQAAGIHLSFSQQLLMVFTLMLTSKGVAGVPRASLVILAGTCAQFDLPEWPIAIILGIDGLMDMARTGTNLVGNCLATAVISRMENEGDF